MAVDTLLGAILMISSAKYNAVTEIPDVEKGE
jgi:hypothetical protein